MNKSFSCANALFVCLFKELPRAHVFTTAQPSHRGLSVRHLGTGHTCGALSAPGGPPRPAAGLGRPGLQDPPGADWVVGTSVRGWQAGSWTEGHERTQRARAAAGRAPPAPRRPRRWSPPCPRLWAASGWGLHQAAGFHRVAGHLSPFPTLAPGPTSSLGSSALMCDCGCPRRPAGRAPAGRRGAEECRPPLSPRWAHLLGGGGCPATATRLQNITIATAGQRLLTSQPWRPGLPTYGLFSINIHTIQ